MFIFKKDGSTVLWHSLTTWICSYSTVCTVIKQRFENPGRHETMNEHQTEFSYTWRHVHPKLNFTPKTAKLCCPYVCQPTIPHPTDYTWTAGNTARKHNRTTELPRKRILRTQNHINYVTNCQNLG